MSKAKKILFGYIEIIAVFVIILAVLIVGSVAASELGLWGTVVAEVLMLAAVVLVCRVRRERVDERFPFTGPPLHSLVSAVWLAVGGYFLIDAASYFMAAFFPALTNTTDTAIYETMLSKSSPTVVVIAVVAVPAICEELIFRGYFLNKLRSFHGGAVMPIIVSSFLFAALHLDLYKLPITFIMGVVFGYIALKTNSVILPMIFHMVNNALAVVSLFTADSAEDAEILVPVIENAHYIYFGIATLALAAGFLFSGLRRFGTINPKKWMRILCPILCLIIVFASVGCFTLASSSTRLDEMQTVEYPALSQYSESFTISKNSYCTIYVQAFQFYGVYAEFIVTDQTGDTVFEASGENCEQTATLVLAPGEYTLSYKLAPGEKNELTAFEAVVAAKVVESFEILGEE